MSTRKPFTWTRILKVSIALVVLAVGAAFASAAEVNGNVSVAKSLQGKAAPTAVLYIIARSANAAGGPPMAVKRFPQPFGNEVKFKLSQSDSMFPEMKFEGKITVSARIAQAGSATPAMPGDLEASKPVPAEIGKTKAINLVIDKIR